MRASLGAALAALVVLGPLALAGCPPSLEDPERFQTGCPAGFSVEAFFLAQCTASACHKSGPTAAAGLDLASADPFDRMYGTTSAACGQPLISPEGPGQSLLIAKLEGTTPCGGRMPLGGTPLTASQLACVEAWITQQVAQAGPPHPVEDAGADAQAGDDAGDAGDGG